MKTYITTHCFKFLIPPPHLENFIGTQGKICHFVFLHLDSDCLVIMAKKLFSL